MIDPDDVKRQVDLAVYEAEERRRRDRWSRSGTMATWCLVVVGVATVTSTAALVIIALLTFLG